MLWYWLSKAKEPMNFSRPVLGTLKLHGEENALRAIYVALTFKNTVASGN